MRELVYLAVGLIGVIYAYLFLLMFVAYVRTVMGETVPAEKTVDESIDEDVDGSHSESTSPCRPYRRKDLPEM